MTKRAAIFHGTDGDPNEHWLPWMKGLLEAAGYEVFVPKLPNSHTPNKVAYGKYLRESGWDFTDNVIVGHSSGATTILNLLSEDWFPKVAIAVLVAAFLNERLLKGVDWVEPGQFGNLFPDSFDAEYIKKKADSFYFVYGSDDPYCNLEDARTLCDELEGKFIVVEGGHHLGTTSGLESLPQLEDIFRQDHIL